MAYRNPGSRSHLFWNIMGMITGEEFFMFTVGKLLK